MVKNVRFVALLEKCSTLCDNGSNNQSFAAAASVTMHVFLLRQFGSLSPFSDQTSLAFP